MSGFMLVYVPRQIGLDFISSYGNILHKYIPLKLMDGDGRESKIERRH